MPPGARGAFYYAQVASRLKCGQDHTVLANVLLEELIRMGEHFGSGKCEECGSSYTASNRGLDGWETRIYAPKARGKER